MKFTRRRLVATSAAAALSAPLLGSGAHASAGWPTKGTIKLIATFPPGGTADTISRILAPKLSAALGAQVVVENKPGAGGTIGSDLAAKAAPDGYTLVISHASPLGIAPGIYPKLPYDVVKDFSHVCLIGHTPNVLIVPGDSPYKTLADYIADAKANPGKVNFGSAGIGTVSHVCGEYFATATEIKLTHIPYKGTGPALADLIGGHIDAVAAAVSWAPLVDAGKIRVLGILGANRIKRWLESRLGRKPVG